MKCKNCNYDLEEDWKVCPICSKPVEKESKKPLIASAIVVLLIIGLLFLNFIFNNITGEESIQKHLEEKYGEEFDKVTFIKSVENPDTNLSCDGSSFGTIKGKGETEHYLVHSDVENMDFNASYNTYTDGYYDNYEFSLKLRKNAGTLYEKVKNAFDNHVEKITFSEDIHNENILPITVNSKEDIYNTLSDSNDGEPFTSIYMYVDMNCFEFCKAEYDNIKMINDYIVELEESTNFYGHVGFLIYTLDGITLEFNRLDSVRIYDKFLTGKAWGEKIEEFIQRDSY